MPIISDPRDVAEQFITGMRAPGPAETPGAGETPGALDTLAAAARSATFAGSLYERFAGSPDPAERGPVPANFDPFEDLTGFEEHARLFASADSPAEVEGVKQRIRVQERDRETLARAGLGGPAATILMSALDPSFLVAIAVPELAIAKAGRTGRAVQLALEGAVGATGYEAALQSLQETRTAEESALNIGAGAVLSGVIGAIIRRAPPAERKAVIDQVRQEFPVNPTEGQSFGAAGARAATTIEQETLARGAGVIAKAQKIVPLIETDLTRVMGSQSVEARRIVQELSDITPMLAKNFEGIATSPSVESRILRHEGRVADLSAELDSLYAQHRTNPQRSPVVGEAPVSRKEFLEAVTVAARHGDTSPYPEVRSGAQYLRERVFDPLKQEAQRLGLLPKDVSVVGAQSYVTRLYDKAAIRAGRSDWDRILTDYFEHQGTTRVEARAIAEDVTRSILRTDAGLANFNAAFRVPNAGPLEARTLAIDDDLIARFLKNDPVEVAKRYVAELAPQIEVTRVFGDRDMAEPLQRVRDEFSVLRERARAAGDDGLNARLEKITQDEQRTMEALVRVRDRIYGRAGRLSPEAGQGERAAANLARGWRNLVASARLGGTAMTGGVQDLSRVAAQYGFAPTFKRLAQLTARPAFREISRANARRMGNAVEVAMSRRLAVASDGAVTDGWTQKLAEGVYKYSGLNHVTDMWRTLAGTLIEDKILGTAADVAAGREVDKLTRARLARIGLDEEALRGIAEQAAQHAEDVDGIRVSNSLAWTDGALAERYETAIVRESRIVVNQPGAADRVWWADGELGKTLGQIKSFSIGAPMRLAAEPAQLAGSGNYLQAARLTGFLMVGGALSYQFRMLAAGKLPTTDPKQLAAEAFSESGVAGVLPDLLSPFARRFGILGESAKFSDRNVLATFGGPALGTLGDAYDVGMNRTANGLSARDLQAIRRLLPFQNLWYLRRAINALEGETAEALNLPGADQATFIERMKRTDALLPSGQRGGTGTGLPPN
jgi:hypothetical protein